MHSHFQEFRQFSRKTLVKTCSCLRQMKTTLISLLLKHSQNKTLKTNPNYMFGQSVMSPLLYEWPSASQQLRTFLSFCRACEAENDLRWLLRTTVSAVLLTRSIVLAYAQVIVLSKVIEVAYIWQKLNRMPSHFNTSSTVDKDLCVVVI